MEIIIKNGFLLSEKSYKRKETGELVKPVRVGYLGGYCVATGAPGIKDGNYTEIRVEVTVTDNARAYNSTEKGIGAFLSKEVRFGVVTSAK